MLVMALSLFCLGQSYAQKNSVSGNGNVIHHPISIEEYTNIEFDANADLYYELRADTASGFRMEIDENLVPFIEVVLKKEKLTRKEKLVIKTTDPVKPTVFKIYTNSRAIKDIDIVGAGNVHMGKNVNTKDLNVHLKGFGTFTANDLLTKSLSVEVSGAGGAVLKGITQSLELKVGNKGSGSINCEDLKAEDVKCDISGSGNMVVNVDKSLDIKISGSGNVTYNGSPRDYSHKLRGVGNISKVTNTEDKNN